MVARLLEGWIGLENGWLGGKQVGGKNQTCNGNPHNGLFSLFMAGWRIVV